MSVAKLTRERHKGLYRNGQNILSGTGINDEERLAMRQGDMPPLVPERVDIPRIRQDRAVQEIQLNPAKMHRATSEDAYTKAWFDCCRNVFLQSVKKTVTNVDLYNVSTYQCSILFQQHGFFPTGRVNSRKLRT